MALTSLAFLKAALNIPDSVTSQDIWLDTLRGAAEQQIKSYCNQFLEYQPSLTEYYNGNGQKFLVLRQRPVLSVAQVLVDYNGDYGDSPNAFDPTATSLTLGVDYTLDRDNTSGISSSGVLIRIRTIWSENARAYIPGKLYAEIGPSTGNIKVQYAAGYRTIPQDLQYAVAYMVSWMKRTLPIGGPLESERFGDYSYRLHYPTRFNEAQYPELGTIAQILNRYRDPCL